MANIAPVLAVGLALSAIALNFAVHKIDEGELSKMCSRSSHFS